MNLLVVLSVAIAYLVVVALVGYGVWGAYQARRRNEIINRVVAHLGGDPASVRSIRVTRAHWYLRDASGNVIQIPNPARVRERKRARP